MGEGGKHLLDEQVVGAGCYRGSKFSISPPSFGGREHVVPGCPWDAELVKSASIRGSDSPAKFSSGNSELKSLLIPAKGLLNGAPRMTGKGPVLTTGLSSDAIGFATPSALSFASSSATPGHV